MDTTADPKPAKSSSPVSNSIPIRINRNTARLIKSIVTKCNKKLYGKKVRVDDVLLKALNLLQEEQIEEIRVSTYTSQDHLEIEYKKFCQANGTVSKDEFLKKLLSAALPQVNQPFNT